MSRNNDCILLPVECIATISPVLLQCILWECLAAVLRAAIGFSKVRLCSCWRRHAVLVPIDDF